MSTWVVYRAYDADDRLIYVGATGNIERRLSNHRSTSWWSSLARRVEVERHPAMPDALRAETEAIRTERPAFNMQHVARDWRQPLQLADGELRACQEWLAVNSYRRAYLPLALRWVADLPVPTPSGSPS